MCVVTKVCSKLCDNLPSESELDARVIVVLMDICARFTK